MRSLRRTQDKINEGIVNLRAPSNSLIGNHINRKATFAAICLLTIVVLGAIIAAFGSSKTVVYANSVEGLEVGITGIKPVQTEFFRSIGDS